MKCRFFVIMYSQNCEAIMPITTGDHDEVKLYKSKESAYKDMRTHSYAQAFGYEIFELGTGDYK